MNAAAPLSALLDGLAEALASERRALLDNDVAALTVAVERKLAAVRAIERLRPPTEAAARIRDLFELNRANGALLARRRRDVAWALRELGRTEHSASYDSRGTCDRTPGARRLCVA